VKTGTSFVTVPFFVSHAGCPNRCVFCDQHAVSGSGGGLPSASQILETVSAYRKTSGGRPLEVAFFGGSFTSLPQGDQEALLAPLAPEMESGGVASIRISARPDAVSDDAVSFLSRMGVRTVEVGVQSMDDAVLLLSGRGHSASDVEFAFRSLRRAGIAAAGQLMPGLPGDTLASSVSSLRRLIELQPAFLRIYPTLVISGTRLSSMCRKGEYVPLTLEDGVGWGKVLLLEAMRAGIPVIRMGLQETGSLAASVEAGPYHPAFRHLVEGALFLDLIKDLTSGLSGAVAVSCSPKDLASVTGHKRSNVERLRGAGIDAAIVAVPAIPRWNVEISCSDGSRSGSVTDLRYQKEEA
jgi:histone acetyltransferase (RNA polymerase elongator complex component)